MDSGVGAVRVGVLSDRVELIAGVMSVIEGCGALLVPQTSADFGSSADLVLVDHLWMEGTGRPPDSTGDRAVLVVALNGEAKEASSTARLLRAAAVVELPRGAAWLAEQISDRPERGSVHAVIGAPGGVGASTVAVALALSAATFGDALLVDADVGGPGLDVALASEGEPGSRWRDIDGASQHLDMDSVRESLPRVEGFWLLSGQQSFEDPVPRAVGAVIDVGRRGFARTVVDLGRVRAARDVVALCDDVFLVVGASVPAVVLARRVMGELLTDTAVHLVVRANGSLDPSAVGEFLGVPVAAEIPTISRLSQSADAGELLAGRSRRKLLGWGETLWRAAA